MTGPRIKGSAVLFSEMTPAPGDEDRFNDWYDDHHTPNHVTGMPGFLSAQRYAAPGGPGYLAVYDLDGAETLETPEYRARKYTPDERTRAMLSSVSGFTRYVGREIDAAFGAGAGIEALDSPFILAAFFAVPDEARPEFEERCRSEHRAVLASPGWRMVRVLEVLAREPDPFTHMALHYVARAEAPEPPAIGAARVVTYRKRGRRFLKTDTFPEGEKR